MANGIRGPTSLSRYGLRTGWCKVTTGTLFAELAGLSGREPREVRDLLPRALEEAGVCEMTSTQAEVKVTCDHIASLHLRGLASWRWVIDIVRETISEGGYAFEFFDEPPAAVYGLDDEP